MSRVAVPAGACSGLGAGVGRHVWQRGSFQQECRAKGVLTQLTNAWPLRLLDPVCYCLRLCPNRLALEHCHWHLAAPTCSAQAPCRSCHAGMCPTAQVLHLCALAPAAVWPSRPSTEAISAVSAVSSLSMLAAGAQGPFSTGDKDSRHSGAGAAVFDIAALPHRLY